MYSSPDVKISYDAHMQGLNGLQQIIQDLISHGLMEMAFVAIRPQIKLQGLKFYTKFIGDVIDSYFRKIRLAGFRANTGEFRAAKTNLVFSARTGVRKGL